MFKNYFLVALRNLRKRATYSFINIFGLSVGLAFCILIFLFVRDEYSYDTFHAKGDRIVRLWRNNPVERMQRSLHPDLVKRVVRLHPKTKAPLLNHISKTTLVEYTNGGGGKDTPKDKLFYDVKILDVYNGIATVKAVSANYVDYLHLAKWDGKWMIVNILWDNR